MVGIYTRVRRLIGHTGRDRTVPVFFVRGYRARPATDDEYMPRLLADWPAHETYHQRTGVRQVVLFEPVSA